MGSWSAQGWRSELGSLRHQLEGVMLKRLEVLTKETTGGGISVKCQFQLSPENSVLRSWVDASRYGSEEKMAESRMKNSRFFCLLSIVFVMLPFKDWVSVQGQHLIYNVDLGHNYKIVCPSIWYKVINTKSVWKDRLVSLLAGWSKMCSYCGVIAWPAFTMGSKNHGFMVCQPVQTSIHQIFTTCYT